MSPDEPIYTDADQTLWKADWGKNRIIGKGTLAMYNNRLVFKSDDKEFVFELKDITDLQIIEQTVIAFATHDRQAYEIKCDYPRNALKYRELIKYLKEGIVT